MKPIHISSVVQIRLLINNPQGSPPFLSQNRPLYLVLAIGQQLIPHSRRFSPFQSPYDFVLSLSTHLRCPRPGGSYSAWNRRFISTGAFVSISHTNIASVFSFLYDVFLAFSPLFWRYNLASWFIGTIGSLKSGIYSDQKIFIG